jgi:hypothetical protein
MDAGEPATATLRRGSRSHRRGAEDWWPCQVSLPDLVPGCTSRFGAFARAQSMAPDPELIQPNPDTPSKLT